MFTRIGGIAAHFVFWLSTLRLAIGVFLAFGTEDMEANRYFANRYLGAETSGEGIDKALMGMGLAVLLGILVEISKSLRLKKDG